MESLQFSEQHRPSQVSNAHVLVFTSGKGGVGKTCITTSVASAMIQKGARVCIFDADTGSTNINTVLGLTPEFTLEQVLSGEKSIHEVVLKTSEGIAVVPGASGIAKCANIIGPEASRLIDAFIDMEKEYDYILIDTAAGIADSVLQFVESAACAFLIITSEPTSLTDAFSLLKLLIANQYSGRLRAVVNQASDYPEATETYRRFASAAEKYLKLNVEYGGFIARDENVPKAMAMHLPVVDLIPNSPASRCLYALADNVLKYIGSEEPESGLADYWSNLLAEMGTSDNAGNVQSTLLAGHSALMPVKEEGRVLQERRVQKDRRAYMPALITAVMVGDLPNKLLAEMKTQRLERNVLESFITEFAQVFVEQYGSFPQNFRQLIFRWLESENYAAPRLSELITTLEALYTTRYQQPLFNLEDSAARLVAQTRGTEVKLRELVNQLRSAYRQSFQQDVFDAEKEILESFQQEDFTEERFEALLHLLLDGYQTRFNKPYQGQSELLLESTADALETMAVEEKNLQDEINLLAQSFQLLTSHRDSLLAAIKAGQTQNVQIKTRTSVNG